MAAVYGVAQSQTQLKQLSSSSKQQHSHNLLKKIHTVIRKGKESSKVNILKIGYECHGHTVEILFFLPISVFPMMVCYGNQSWDLSQRPR